MRAIALLSGGLDGTLAVKIMLEQGIEITAVNFSTSLCQCNRQSDCGLSEAQKAADRLGVELKIFNVAAELLELVKSPKHGYGKNLNPCIDCRILMNRKAKEYMQEIGASFIITGEVLGQRPMSQHKAALRLIEKESGLAGLILRPLSAKLLPASIPEEKGWVDRERFLAISGRSRKPQMALAKKYQIGDYPSPAGGCLLTDSGFSRRLKDLINYSEITLTDIELLKAGRHFRISERAKVVVGRNEEENTKLTSLRKSGDIYFRPEGIKGPVAIGRGKFSQEDLQFSSRIIARYCDHNGNGKIKITNQIWPEAKVDLQQVKPIEHSQLQKLRL